MMADRQPDDIQAWVEYRGDLAPVSDLNARTGELMRIFSAVAPVLAAHQAVPDPQTFTTAGQSIRVSMPGKNFDALEKALKKENFSLNPDMDYSRLPSALC